MEIWSIPGFWRKMKVQIRCRSALVQIKLICTLLYQQKFDLCHNFWWIKGGTDQFDLYSTFPWKPWSAKWSLPLFLYTTLICTPFLMKKQGTDQFQISKNIKDFLCIDQAFVLNKGYRSIWTVPVVSKVFVICTLEKSTDQIDLYLWLSSFSWSESFAWSISDWMRLNPTGPFFGGGMQ